MIVYGKKQRDKSWSLEIILLDKYDFTDLKELGEYIKNDGSNEFKNFALAFGNNLAMIGTSCNVVHEYKIKIEFKIERWRE